MCEIVDLQLYIHSIFNPQNRYRSIWQAILANIKLAKASGWKQNDQKINSW